MKKRLFKQAIFGMATLIACTMSSCNNDGPSPDDGGDRGERWITVAGALMQDEPGDGNGGTRVYAVSVENAKDPGYSIDVFDNGFGVKSQRTARLQSSNDGSFIYNIQYVGADGGVFNKYDVQGGGSFPEADVAVNTQPYVGSNPRWGKINEQIGIAVNIASPTNVVENDNYIRTIGEATVLAIDLENVLIEGSQTFHFNLSAEEEAQGYHIWRLDAPQLNAAGNKLYISAWMRKNIPGTTEQDQGADRLGTKTIVMDYPSLANAEIITSGIATGDATGFRSPHITQLAEDGYVYQGTHRELAGTGGSHILRIGSDNQYDDDYVFSLDEALSVTDSYIETWKYAGGGIGYVLLRHGGESKGYVARVDLNARTADFVNIPGNPNFTFSQYQSILSHGDEIFMALAPVGQDGNIYIFNRAGEVTQGAKLINKLGNQYIGVH